MDPILSVSYKTVANFLDAAQGNYRNAMYVQCSCSYEKESGCQDFLFIPGFDSCPIILPVIDSNRFFPVPVEKDECAAIISSHTFLRLYHKWLQMVTSSDVVCPVLQLLYIQNKYLGEKPVNNQIFD